MMRNNIRGVGNEIWMWQVGKEGFEVRGNNVSLV